MAWSTRDIGAFKAVTGGGGATPPTVDAGGPYTGEELTAISIDGTVVAGSDPSPIILWTELSALGGTFGDASQIDTTFTPDGPGDYTLQLSANPSDGDPVVDTVALTSTPAPPVLQANDSNIFTVTVNP